MVSISATLVASLVNSASVFDVAQDAGLEPLMYFNASFWSAFQGESLRPENGWHFLLTAMVCAAILRCLMHVINQWALHGILESSAVIRAMLFVLVVTVGLSVYLRFLYSFQDTGYPWRLQVFQGRFLLGSLAPLALLTADGLDLAAIEARVCSLAVGVLSILALFDLISRRIASDHPRLVITSQHGDNSTELVALVGPSNIDYQGGGCRR